MAEAAHAQPAWVPLAYLIAGVCFILALRGLSSPTSSRRGNYIGMVGMAIAVITTLIIHVSATPVCVDAPANDPDYYNRCWGTETFVFLLIPAAIAVGEGYVWVADSGDGSVTRLDPPAGRRAGRPVRVGTRPMAIRTGAGSVWVANRGSGTVSRISRQTARPRSR